MSTGARGGTDTADILPFELAERPIRPTTAPLASQGVDIPVFASSGNELLVDKLDAMAERGGPDRQWAKIAKYSAYASRGFGPFNPTIGLAGVWIGATESNSTPIEQSEDRIAGP